MLGASDTLTVKELKENHRILIEWDSDLTKVELNFEPIGEDATLVKIANWGFPGSLEKILSQAVDAKGGYTIVLAGLKSWLEHGIELNLVRDQFPKGYPT